MKITEFDLERREGRRIPSPGRCIYCGAADVPLTDEHVVPFALGANSIVLEKSCCTDCQKIIQKYEQEVLKKQLGVFRAQVDAPTRNRKERPSDVPMHFVEVNEQGLVISDLGTRSIALGEAPLMVSLWSSPLPRLLNPSGSVQLIGEPWTYFDQQVMTSIVMQVAKETGAKHVAAKIGEVNRVHYLRSLAKTAHAYAAAEIGLDAFDQVLVDLILCRRDDVETFVGDLPHESPFEADESHTLQIAVGEALDGPAAGYLVARIVLYPMLGSPAHVVVLGRPCVGRLTPMVHCDDC